MKGKKPLLLVVLVAALLAVGLIVPAAASAKSDNTPAQWGNWAQSGRYVLEDYPVTLPTGEVIYVDVPWKATFAVHVRQVDSNPMGHEVMNWQAALDPTGTGTPPWTHNRTTDLVACQFDVVAYRVTFIFRYDTSELGWPERYVLKGDVYHVWVLTDNRGGGMDHVDLYTGMSLDPIDLSDLPWGTQILDLDCRGVQVVN